MITISDEVMVAIIMSLASTIAAIVAAIATIENRKRSIEIKDQVKNTHSTNLREDIDEIKSSVGAVIRGQDTLHEANNVMSERMTNIARRLDDNHRGVNAEFKRVWETLKRRRQ